MFTQAQLKELTAQLRYFGSNTRVRGQHYARTGRVGPLAVDGHCVRATVRGTDVYQTLWEWTGESWEPDCSCPVAPYCKHAYAVACCLVARGATPGATAPRTPPAPQKVAAAQPPAVPGSAVLEKLRAARERWALERYFTQLV